MAYLPSVIIDCSIRRVACCCTIILLFNKIGLSQISSSKCIDLIAMRAEIQILSSLPYLTFTVTFTETQLAQESNKY